MATEKDTALLVAELSANYNRLKKDLDKANGIAVKGRAQLENGFRKSNSSIAKSADDMSRSVSRSYDRATTSALQSVNGLKSALLSSAAAIGAAFGANEIVNLADGYTRFTNQLKTAGLESENLADVQDRLFETAQKYGVELEALGTLYGRNASAAKELNLGTSQQLQLTNAVAAALKIQGGSTEAASGALLQLSQALGGSVIQATEYNSLIDGLRPLLQGMAAASDKYKGSVAALTKDVKAGNVTNKEFADLILKASAGLEQRATKSNLTIAASFQVVNNALGKYIGETDASLSATQRISQGLVLFANNLDKVIPALVVIVGLIGARYAAAGAIFVATETARTAALVRSTLATEAAAVANAQLAAAGLRGTLTAASQTAAISTQAVAMGVAATAARGFGASMLAAFGGPVGLAILAVGAALALVVVRSNSVVEASAEVKAATTALDGALRNYENAALLASIATGEGAKSARDAAAAAREQAIQEQNKTRELLNQAKAQLVLAKAESTRANSSLNFQVAGGFSAGAKVAGVSAANADTAKAVANVTALETQLSKVEKDLVNIDKILNAKAPSNTILDPKQPKVISQAAQEKIDAAKDGRFATSTSGAQRRMLEDLAKVQSIAVEQTDDFADLWAEQIAQGTGRGLEEGIAEFERASDALAALQQANYDATYNGIRGALEAVKDDGVTGFAQYLGESLQRAALDGLAKALTDAFTGGGQSTGGGFVAALLAAIPGFATGTNYAPGGLAMVHKNELVSLPRGAQVNTVAQTAAMMSRNPPPMRPTYRQEISFRQTLDLTGANGDEQIYAIARAASREGAAAALTAANAAAPGRQISFVKLGT